MVSWYLWRSLHNPPIKHPIYRRANARTLPTSEKTHRFPIYWILIILLILMAAAKLLQINFVVLLLSLPILLILLVMVSPLLLPFVIFGFGAYLATRISHVIFMEKQQATYDLLHLPPKQPIRADWTLATGMLYRGQFFGLLNFAVRFVVIAACGVLLIMMLAFLASGSGLQTMIEIVALLALFYTGYIQSIILSILLGLLVPHFTANVEQNGLNATLSYTVIQAGSYLLALLIGFGLLPLLYARLNINNQWADVSLILWCFVLSYGIREAVISYLWRYLVFILNGDAKLLE